MCSIIDSGEKMLTRKTLSSYKEYKKAEKKREREIRENLSRYPNLFSKAMDNKKVSYKLKKEKGRSDISYMVKFRKRNYIFGSRKRKKCVRKEDFFSFNINYRDILNDSLSLKGMISEVDKNVNTKKTSNLCDKVLKEFS